MVILKPLAVSGTLGYGLSMSYTAEILTPYRTDGGPAGYPVRRRKRFTGLAHASIVTGVMQAAPLSPLLPSRDIFREAVFIACAGFIGTLAAKLVAADQVAAAIGLADIPGWQVLWALTITVWVFGQVGLSPITMAVFLGSMVAELPDMPVDMTLAALAIAAGTAVCSTGAPFSSGPLMLARATGYSSFTLTWRWNRVYTLIAIAVLGAIYFILTNV